MPFAPMLRGGADARRRDELIERFDLDPTKKGRTYSKGNRQKVALIAALASRVDLLLLDEPTAGLDPLMEVVFQEIVHEATSGGATVLLSSHILAQVEKLADRVSIIRRGRIIESGTLPQLRHLTRTAIEAVIDVDYVWPILAVHLAYVPAVWTVLAVAACLYGIVPRVVGAAWALFGFAMVIGTFGALMDLPSWVAGLSPFQHIARLLLDSLAWTPLIVLIVVALVLSSMGLAGFRRRDLESR